MGSVPGLVKSPGEGNGNSFQYSCLGNPMDRGDWQATVHWVEKSQTQFRNATATKMMVNKKVCVHEKTLLWKNILWYINVQNTKWKVQVINTVCIMFLFKSTHVCRNKDDQYFTALIYGWHDYGWFFKIYFSISTFFFIWIWISFVNEWKLLSSVRLFATP